MEDIQWSGDNSYGFVTAKSATNLKQGATTTHPHHHHGAAADDHQPPTQSSISTPPRHYLISLIPLPSAAPSQSPSIAITNHPFLNAPH
jgi:hypothetical protein